ncbi:hypothetical protein FAP94_03805 [Morganella morganii]|nr:hypothetical protein [Morganella morganii]
MQLHFHLPQITQKLTKANSTADVTFDDMDVIVEPPWMASRRVTKAVEFDVLWHGEITLTLCYLK